jgi:hypothetical protein
MIIYCKFKRHVWKFKNYKKHKKFYSERKIFWGDQMLRFEYNLEVSNTILSPERWKINSESCGRKYFILEAFQNKIILFLLNTQRVNYCRDGFWEKGSCGIHEKFLSWWHLWTKNLRVTEFTKNNNFTVNLKIKYIFMSAFTNRIILSH